MTTILAAWMAAHYMTDKELSEKTGISRVQVLRLRHGVHRPSLRNARKIEQVTGIAAGRLMAGDP